MIGAAGAAGALLIPNIDLVKTALGTGGTRVCVFWLFVSILVGILEKALSLFVAYITNLGANLPVKLDEVTKTFDAEYAELDRLADHVGILREDRADGSQLKRELVNSTPWLVRKLAEFGMRKGEKDWLYGVRMGVKCFWWQTFFVGMQFISFLLFVGSASFYLSI